MAAESRAHTNLELVTWALLAAATLGSAWCAYQGSLWSSEQVRHLAVASVAQFASLRKTTIANRDLSVDAATYIAYVEADLHGDTKVARFLRDHARPGFKPALEAWIAAQAGGPGDGANPFRRPEYRIAEWEQADALNGRAARALQDANMANATGDTYLLHTVLFALVLFLIGGTAQAHKRGIQHAMLVLGALAFTLTVISMARLPRTRPDRPRASQVALPAADLIGE